MATYAAMMEQMDAQIGRVVQYLKDIGEYENTLIIYLSDNGADGKGRSDFFNSPFLGAKTSLREGGTKTHLIMHWPKGIKESGKIVDQWVHIFDFLPTFLDIAGVTYPEKNAKGEKVQLEGISILPFLKGEEKTERKYLFWDLYGEKSAIFRERWKWYQDRNGEDHLFDLQADGTETENLAKENPRMILQLKEAHEEFSKANHVLPHKRVLKAQKGNEWNRLYPK